MTRGQAVCRPSTSIVLSNVCEELTKDEIKSYFEGYGNIENIVYHYITPTIYTGCVTVVFQSIEMAKLFCSKHPGNKFGNPPIFFHYSFRLYDLSLSHSEKQELIYQNQFDDIRTDLNPFNPGYFIQNWAHFKDFQEIPIDSTLIYLRYNEIESFDLQFEFLTELNLIGNNLKQMAPLTNFPNLKLLNISNNCLQHFPVFSETIENIDASYNQIIDIDESIINAKKLTTLTANSNKIRHLPLLPPNLTKLHVEDNEIETIQPSVLSNILEFAINKNKLSEIPNSFQGKFPKSHVLLNCNRYSTFDLSFFIKTIGEINLSLCNLTEFPSATFELPNLSTLLLFGNQISEIPPDFSTSHVTILDVSMNPISILPPVPQHMSDLRINHCLISDVCESISNNNRIRFFYAVGNKLKKLPNFQNIEELFASRNEITEFPTISTRSSSKKVFLDLSHNQIKTLPRNLRMHFSLFDISYNPIEEIPKELLFSNNASYNFCGIPSLTMEINLNELTRISFLNVFGTNIKVNSLNPSKQVVIDEMKFGHHPYTPQTIYFECDKSVGFSDTIGKRNSMEDTMVIRQHFCKRQDANSEIWTALFGLFDGHKNANTARYAARAFPDLCKLYLESDQDCDFSTIRFDRTTQFLTTQSDANSPPISSNNKENSTKETLGNVFQNSETSTTNTEKENKNYNTELETFSGSNPTEIYFNSKKEIDSDAILQICANFQNKMVSINEESGSTMEFIVLNSNGHTIVSHLGDSKTVIYGTNGEVFYENIEQRPSLRSEVERLREEKVTIRKMRTAGILAMTRSLGDVQVKGVSHVPTNDILDLDLTSDTNKWIVIGCDGVWDEMELKSVGELLKKANNAQEAATFIRDEALERNSSDNISVLVVDLHSVFQNSQ